MSSEGIAAAAQRSSGDEENGIDDLPVDRAEAAGLLSSQAADHDDDHAAAAVSNNKNDRRVRWLAASPTKSQHSRLTFFFVVLVVTVVGFAFFFAALSGPCGSLTNFDCQVQHSEPEQQQEQQPPVTPSLSPSPSPIPSTQPPTPPQEEEHEEEEAPEQGQDPKPTGFRRPQTDYLLDSNWDFNASPTTRHYYWTVTDMEANPDGVFRPMILINGQFPGPMIECNDGDRLVIHIDNQAVNATSFHWHGIYQNGTNWMDGAVGVTQCPIAPGGNFTYDFTIKGQHGTYW